MAKITIERVKKINSECKNDFKLDIQYYVMHSEYNLYKCIDLDKENYVKAYIMFRDYRDKENPYKYTGKYQVYLNVSKWYHKEGDYFASSSGLGKSVLLSEETFDKKAVKTLQKFTENVTEEMIMQIYKEYYEKIIDKRII